MESSKPGAYQDQGSHRSESGTSHSDDGQHSSGQPVNRPASSPNTKPVSVQVQIFGQRCNIVGEESPDHVRHLAEIVDRKMNEIACQSRGIPALKIAILTALNLTHDLVQIAERHRDIAERGEKMISLIDEAVEE